MKMIIILFIGLFLNGSVHIALFLTCLNLKAGG